MVLGTVGFGLLGQKHVLSLVLPRTQSVLTNIAMPLRDAVVYSWEKVGSLEDVVRKGEFVALDGCGDAFGHASVVELVENGILQTSLAL